MIYESLPACLALFLLFVSGLVLGSFLNVCISRLPRGESVVAPPSRCPACRTRLRVTDLVPVLSYLWLRGRCRYCGEGIPGRYPLVEAASAGLVAGLFWLYPWPGALWYTVPVLAALAAAVTDLETGEIPDTLVLPVLGVGLLLGPVSPLAPWWAGGLGALAGGGVLLVIAVASRGGMGGGDIKLMAALGAWLGLEGTFMVMVLSFLLGGGAGIVILALKIRGRNDPLAFGPYIALALFLALLAREPLLDAYWGLIYRLGLL